MGYKVAGADLLFKGGLLNGSRHVGLLDASDAELSGNAYARIALALAAWTKGTSAYSNTAAIQFPQPNPAAWGAIGGWSLHSAATAGDVLADDDLPADTSAPQLGASVRINAGTLVVSLSGAVLAAGSLKAMDEGLLSGTRALSLHSAAVPSTSNQQDDSVTIAAASWTLDTQDAVSSGPAEDQHPKRRRARNNTVVSFGVQTSNLPALMTVALRDGTATSADILWYDQFSTEDPSLGDTLTFPVNALAIHIPVD